MKFLPIQVNVPCTINNTTYITHTEYYGDPLCSYNFGDTTRCINFVKVKFIYITYFKYSNFYITVASINFMK